MEVRPATSPAEVATAAPAALRERFVVDSLFSPGRLELGYAHEDRFVLGGAVPTAEPLRLEPAGPVNGRTFLEGREAGILNIGGGPAVVTVDGTPHVLGRRDVLYVGRGAETVELASQDPATPSRLYLLSSLAHRDHPTTRVASADVEPVVIGTAEQASERRLYQLIHPDRVAGCTLLMGVTVLAPGSVWNTMPCHLHDRRSEIYLYVDLPPAERVVHLMGRPDATRHLLLANEQAVISPAWSIHTGAGTAPYAFVWATAGENRTYDDMDQVPTASLR